jgi:hypothetical protein
MGRKSQFTQERIIQALQEVDAGAKPEEAHGRREDLALPGGQGIVAGAERGERQSGVHHSLPCRHPADGLGQLRRGRVLRQEYTDARGHRPPEIAESPVRAGAASDPDAVSLEIALPPHLTFFPRGAKSARSPTTVVPRGWRADGGMGES